MSESDYGVALFHTTSAALRSEKTLARSGFLVKLIPTPRQFSSDCGISLRFAWIQVEAVREALAASQVEVAGIERLE